MTLPENLRYSPDHLWLQPEADGAIAVGITDHAQDLLGDVVFVELPAIGAHLAKGDACGLIESVKTGSDLHAPLAGEVVAVNETLSSQPERINDAPYQSWIFKIRPDAPDALAALLDAAAYRKLIAD